MSTETTTTKKLKPIDEIRTNLVALAPQFVHALPSHITVEKFQRVAVTAIQMNPDLITADRNSLYAACMKAAQDGLLPDGKEAAFVTFGNVVTYMPMIAGIYKKIRNSGEVRSITSGIIYKGEFTHYTDETGEHFRHEPNYFAADRGPELGAFAQGITKDGGVYLEVMTRAQIEAIRLGAKSKDSPAWKNHWSEMARKVVTRRLAKRLPSSTDLDSTLAADDDFFEGETIDGKTGEVVQTPAAGKRGPKPKPAAGAAPPGLADVASQAPKGDDLEIPAHLRGSAADQAAARSGAAPVVTPPAAVTIEHEPNDDDSGDAGDSPI